MWKLSNLLNVTENDNADADENSTFAASETKAVK